VLAPMLACLAAGCTVGPSWKQQSIWSPPSWFGAGHAAPHGVASEPVLEPIDPNWWNIFQDAELTALEQRVAAIDLPVLGGQIDLVVRAIIQGLAAEL